jgi:transposase-like protein
VLVSTRRDAATARRFFQRALTTLKVTPSEVVTDAAPICPAVVEDMIPSAWHHVERQRAARRRFVAACGALPAALADRETAGPRLLDRGTIR